MDAHCACSTPISCCCWNIIKGPSVEYHHLTNIKYTTGRPRTQSPPLIFTPTEFMLDSERKLILSRCSGDLKNRWCPLQPIPGLRRSKNGFSLKISLALELSQPKKIGNCARKANSNPEAHWGPARWCCGGVAARSWGHTDSTWKQRVAVHRSAANNGLSAQPADPLWVPRPPGDRLALICGRPHVVTQKCCSEVGAGVHILKLGIESGEVPRKVLQGV